MAYYTELEFYKDNFLYDFIENCELAHDIAVENAMKVAEKNGWGKVTRKDFGHAYTDIVTESIQAFINIYGSGKSMAHESDNPFLNDYKDSDLWNNERPSNNAVMYRKNDYKSLDWKNNKNTIINRTGSGKDGEYDKFPSQSKHLERMSKVFDEYRDTFQYHISHYMTTMIERLDIYTTSKKVKV